MDATRRPDVGAVARRTMPDYLLKTVGLVYYSVEDLNLRSSHDRCNNSVHINGCQSRASTDMDTHRGTIRKRAIAAIQPEPGAATCEPVALQATKASLLLSAVEIARDACGELMKDENTKRVGILVLYPKNDEMVNDLRVNLKDCGGEDVDVVACTENKEKFDELVKVEGSSVDECTGERRGAKFACFLANKLARAHSAMFMYIPRVGHGTPPLLDDNSARSLVVCVPIEGIQEEKVKKSDTLLNAFTGAYSGGFRICSALSREPPKKFNWFLEKMKIPTLFHLVSEPRKRKRHMSEEKKAERGRKRQEQRMSHLKAEDNAAKLSIYFRCDLPRSKLKDVIDDINRWRIDVGSSTPDDDLARWENRLPKDSPLQNTLNVQRSNRQKWLCHIYWIAVLKLRQHYFLPSKLGSDEWSDYHADLVLDTCRQWINSVGSLGSRLPASYVLSLLRRRPDFVDIFAIFKADGNVEQTLLQPFTDAVKGVEGHEREGLSQSKLAEPLVGII